MKTTTDGACAPETDCLYRFQVTTDLCPQALLRVLGLVAQNSLIPRSVACERRGDWLYAKLAIDGLSPARAEILRAKIEAIVTVREAFLSRY